MDLFDEEELRRQQAMQGPKEDLMSQVPTQEMPPSLVDMLIAKYPERLAGLKADREKRLAEFDQKNDIGGGSRFLAGIAGALGAGDSTEILQTKRNNILSKRKNLESLLDQDRRDVEGELDFGKTAIGLKRDETRDQREGIKFKQEQEDYATERDLKARESDPNSKESAFANQLAKEMGYKGRPLTAAEFKDKSKYFEKIYDMKAKDRDFNQQERHFNQTLAQRAADRALQRESNAKEDNWRKMMTIQKFEEEAPKRAYNNLPEEKKQTIEGLAKKNVNKVAIANQIDSVISNWDSLTESEKLIQGRQLIKTLNSAEGADAVGTEEAKRLGSNLEFAMGNLTNDNPIQFGRNLKGFKKQSEDTSKAIRRAINMNNDLIDEAYGRPRSSGSKSYGDDVKAYAAKHGISLEAAQAQKDARGG